MGNVLGHGLDEGALRLVVGHAALAGLGVFDGDLQVLGHETVACEVSCAEVINTTATAKRQSQRMGLSFIMYNVLRIAQELDFPRSSAVGEGRTGKERVP